MEGSVGGCANTTNVAFCGQIRLLTSDKRVELVENKRTSRTRGIKHGILNGTCSIGDWLKGVCSKAESKGLSSSPTCLWVSKFQTSTHWISLENKILKEKIRTLRFASLVLRTFLFVRTRTVDHLSLSSWVASNCLRSTKLCHSFFFCFCPKEKKGEENGKKLLRLSDRSWGHCPVWPDRSLILFPRSDDRSGNSYQFLSIQLHYVLGLVEPKN